MTKIVIEKDSDVSVVETQGYVLFYLEEGVVNVKGNVPLTSLAPILLKYMANKLS